MPLSNLTTLESTNLYCTICGEALKHDNNLVEPCRSLAEARHELTNLTVFLDGINAPPGDTATERVEAVVRHYATQIGRWAKKESV